MEAVGAVGAEDETSRAWDTSKVHGTSNVAGKNLCQKETGKKCECERKCGVDRAFIRDCSGSGCRHQQRREKEGEAPARVAGPARGRREGEKWCESGGRAVVNDGEWARKRWDTSTSHGRSTNTSRIEQRRTPAAPVEAETPT